MAEAEEISSDEFKMLLLSSGEHPDYQSWEGFEKLCRGAISMNERNGRKRLRDLAGTRGTASGAKAIKLLFAPEALKILPSKKSDPTLWQQSFVEFVAMRGYGFHGMTKPLSPGGTELKGITSAKSGVRLIHNSWSRGLLDANCKDSEDGKSSSWFILFDADWKQDRRVVGFWIRFEVDALPRPTTRASTMGRTWSSSSKSPIRMIGATMAKRPRTWMTRVSFARSGVSCSKR